MKNTTLTEKEKYQMRIERLADDFFVKLFYEDDKKESDWFLRPDATIEDLRLAILGLRYYKQTVKSPSEVALRAAYRKGQDSVRAARSIDAFKEDKDIKEILGLLTEEQHDR